MHTEEALRESEERLRSITDTAKDGIITLDSNGDVSFWNQAAEKLFGYSANDIIGRNFHDIVAPTRFREAHRRAFALWQETGEGEVIGKPVEMTALHQDGTEIPVELSLSSTSISGRQFAVGIVRDIRERNKVLEELRKSREFFDGIIDAIADPLFVKDERHTYVAVNNSMCKLMGKSRAEIVGKNDFDYFPKEQADIFRE
jgi:PAS domain S-box-containing protein